MNHSEQTLQPERTARLRPLLEHLDRTEAGAGAACPGWEITRIEGGANNLLYRAVSADEDIAVKFCIQDERDRAGREFASLNALQELGLDLAPVPLLLDRERYGQPVIVQTWLKGSLLTEPPAAEAEWRCLLEYFALLHTVTPDRASFRFPPAFLNMSSADAGKQLIRHQRTLFPEEAQPPALRRLVQQIQEKAFPRWPEPPLVLCHADSNGLNFLRREGVWAAVDWEYSGWGDGAFEIADIITHPFYAEVSSSRWEWVMPFYAAQRRDPQAVTRIRSYVVLLNTWWAVRQARMLYDIPRGLDSRMAERPVGYLDYLQAKFETTLQQAEAGLSLLL